MHTNKNNMAIKIIFNETYCDLVFIIFFLKQKGNTL